MKSRSDITLYTEKGEELFMSYGSHPNDFLLVECEHRCLPCFDAILTSYEDGFFLDVNESDAIYLDDIVYTELTAAHKKELLSRQLYGYKDLKSPTAISWMLTFDLATTK
jgi:hypothetical protein